ncbi:MAG: ATP-binding protein, partial [Bacteroidota bacterium]
MDHPDARDLRRTLILSQAVLAALVLLTLLLAHAWDSVAAQLGVVGTLLMAYALVVVRPLGKRIEETVGGALRRAEALQREVAEEKEARAKAEEEVKTKSAFLAAMSHEIRTPMNGVIGMASLLEDSHLDGAQRDFVHTIRSSGDVLLTLINDVLDLSKIEAGEVTPEVKPVALRPLVEAAFDLVASRAAGKDVELVYAPAPGIPDQVATDPTRLRQVLVNLLSNAVKHTARGEVVVTARWERSGDAPRLHVDVRDTGAGIDAADLPHLFEPYRQGTNPAEGTGLGLHICKQLVRLLGGTISADSLVGVGSTFSFSIDAPSVERESAGDEATLDLHGRTVLLIVPNRALREALTVRLRTWGADAEAVASVAEATAWAQQGQRCHGLVFDLSTPDADAFEALRAQFERVPVIALTSLRETAASISVQTSLAKPVKDDALRRALTEVLVAAAPATEANPARLVGSAERRVLLVEDNPVNQKVALRLLERLGIVAD